MKPAKIFQQYIWFINTLRTYKHLTFEQLNQKWQQDGMADCNALPRSSFNRHRDAILDMFGIIIDCDPKTYCYYISTLRCWGMTALNGGFSLRLPSMACYQTA